MLGTLLLFLIGLISHHFIEAILYEIILSTSRSILGGYHCKSYTRCITLYVSLYVLCLILNTFTFSYIHIFMIQLISFLITLTCCPVQNVNKPVSQRKYQIFKKYSLIYISLYIVIIDCLFIINNHYINFMTCTLVTIQILTLGGKIDYEKIQK